MMYIIGIMGIYLIAEDLVNDYKEFKAKKRG